MKSYSFDIIDEKLKEAEDTFEYFDRAAEKAAHLDGLVKPDALKERAYQAIFLALADDNPLIQYLDKEGVQHYIELGQIDQPEGLIQVIVHILDDTDLLIAKLANYGWPVLEEIGDS